MSKNATKLPKGGVGAIGSVNRARRAAAAKAIYSPDGAGRAKAVKAAKVDVNPLKTTKPKAKALTKHEAPVSRMIVGARMPNLGAKGKPVVADSKSKQISITFGDVTIITRAPAKAEIQQNVVQGAFALKQVKKRLVKSGVNLRISQAIPLYSVDENDPKVIIRNQGGVKMRGHFVDGEFRIKR